MSVASPEVLTSLNTVKPHRLIGKKCSGTGRVILKQHQSREIKRFMLAVTFDLENKLDDLSY